MSRLFIAVSLLILLTSACNRPFAASTSAVEEIQFTQPMASATPTALFHSIDSNGAGTPTPSLLRQQLNCPVPRPNPM
jgi:predicted secreted Zn-dependent protease